MKSFQSLNPDRYAFKLKRSSHPPLRGELADLLANHPPVECLRSIRLLALDVQLKQLLGGEHAPQMEALVKHLGAAIALAEGIDWTSLAAPGVLPDTCGDHI